MKKIVIVVSCIIITGLFFVFYPFHQEKQNKVLGATSQLNPGIYKVEYDTADFRGWKAFLVMEVTPEKEIGDIKFDYVNNSGIVKTQDLEYNKKMKSKNGIGPMDYCPRFAKNLRIYQNPNEIDGITGATLSSRDFKVFSQAVFKAAKNGDTSTIYIPQPELVASNVEVKN